MDADGYKAAIKALNLNQTIAARFLGISLNTSQRYAQGKRPVPRHIAMLLLLMLHLDITPLTALETARLPVEDFSDGQISDGKQSAR